MCVVADASSVTSDTGVTISSRVRSVCAAALLFAVPLENCVLSLLVLLVTAERQVEAPRSAASQPLTQRIAGVSRGHRPRTRQSVCQPPEPKKDKEQQTQKQMNEKQNKEKHTHGT